MFESYIFENDIKKHRDLTTAIGMQEQIQWPKRLGTKEYLKTWRSKNHH